MNPRILPVLLTFFVMGVADAMGPLADQVRTRFHLSHAAATLLTFFVFIAFAVFSIPGGLLAARLGKRRLLLLGLALNGLAVAVPTFLDPSFHLLLLCIFLLGVGTTFLQVAGNPFMRDVSAPGAYARNLSFAQFIKGIGSSSSAVFVGLAAALPLLAGWGWRAPFPVFLLFMLLAFLGVATVKTEEAKADVPPSLGSSLALLGERRFLFAVLGIFLYVGAEVCLARYANGHLLSVGLSPAQAARYGAALFFVALTAGRLLGSGVLTFMGPRPFFRLSAAMGLLGLALLMTGWAAAAIPAVALCGLGFANIWPLLFSITVEARPERSSELSGLMCMAISGGALVPLLMGRMADQGRGPLAFVVPLACFAYLLVLSLRQAQVAR
jgi:fucose permease